MKNAKFSPVTIPVTLLSLFSRDYEMRRSCDHLDTLILRGNQIQELEARLFKDCHKLRELSLSFNQINRIDSEAFRSDHL